MARHSSALNSSLFTIHSLQFKQLVCFHFTYINVYNYEHNLFFGVADLHCYMVLQFV